MFRLTRGDVWRFGATTTITCGRLRHWAVSRPPRAARSRNWTAPLPRWGGYVEIGMKDTEFHLRILASNVSDASVD